MILFVIVVLSLSRDYHGGIEGTEIHGVMRVYASFAPKVMRSVVVYLITFLNSQSFPLKGGYLTLGSNQVGLFITAFRWLNVSKEFLP